LGVGVWPFIESLKWVVLGLVRERVWVLVHEGFRPLAVWVMLSIDW